ncbi:MAG: CotH kinase family protein, partial [Bacteroides sp.]
TGNMILLDEDFNMRYTGSLSQIKGRGNSTWAFTDKKSYQIKLEKKESLIYPGMKKEKSKTWLLLANPFDPTLIRNDLTYSFAKELGLSGSPDSVPVDLYYDGEYRGSYLLCEKISVGSGRVEIDDLEGDIEEANPGIDDFDDLPTSIGTNKYGNEIKWVEGLVDPVDSSGGYLFELDDAYYGLEKSYFVTGDGTAFVSKSPEYLSRSQVEYISGFVEEIIRCIKNGGVNRETGKGLFDYIDKDSFTKYFFVQDWSKNADSFISSTFFYKPAGEDKLYAGPVWDCDASFGIRSNINTFASSQGWLARGFAKDLIDIPAFRQALKSTYETEISPVLFSTLLGTVGGIYVEPFGSYVSKLSQSSSMNYVLWSFNDCMGTFSLASSYWENVDNMHTWMWSRSSWIDEEILREDFAGDVSADTGLGYGAVYDAAYYTANNPDVAAAYGDSDREGTFSHFLNFGMAEGRRANETFDVNRYKATYIDLRDAFGDDNRAYYRHYIEYGQFEGRVA